MCSSVQKLSLSRTLGHGGGELESGAETWKGEAMGRPVLLEKESLKFDIWWQVKQCPIDGTWP